jgi:hypothetical protein
MPGFLVNTFILKKTGSNIFQDMHCTVKVEMEVQVQDWSGGVREWSAGRSYSL